MPTTDPSARRLNEAIIHLDHLTHNLSPLQRQVRDVALWPVLKANAYGHDANIIGAHLVCLGCEHFCVADAAILDLPASHFDAVRPGIALYGLRPSAGIDNACVQELKPVLEWKSRITFLKKVPAGAGLSYGHAFHTKQPSLIAAVPMGYGDGLPRNLSNQLEVLVGGVRCPQVGRITMDMSLIDVTALQGRVALGDEVAIIGRQGKEEITADELAATLGTINYEIATRIAHRVPRVAVGADA